MKNSFFIAALFLTILQIACVEKNEIVEEAIEIGKPYLRAELPEDIFASNDVMQFNSNGQHNVNTVVRFKDADSFSKLASYCNALSGEKQIPVAIVLYDIDGVNACKKFKEECLVGFSSYLYDELSKQLYHHLFIKNKKGDFVEDKGYLLEARGVIYGQIEFFKRHIQSVGYENTVYTLLVSNDFKKYYDSRDAVSIKIAAFNNTLKIPDDPGGGCGSPCADDRGDCEEYDEGLEQCYMGPCGATHVEDELRLSGSYSENELTATFDYDLFYEFRDSFLYSSVIGEQYAGYYYSLSGFLINNLSFNRLIAAYELIPDVKQVVVKLLNPTQFSNDILISTSLKGSMISFLNDYKTVSSNPDYTAIMDAIISDVNYFSGKTVSQVLVEIQ